MLISEVVYPVAPHLAIPALSVNHAKLGFDLSEAGGLLSPLFHHCDAMLPVGT